MLKCTIEEPMAKSREYPCILKYNGNYVLALNSVEGILLQGRSNNLQLCKYDNDSYEPVISGTKITLEVE